MEKMTMKCLKCGIEMLEKRQQIGKEHFEHRYWHCPKCKEELIDMEQLHEVAEKERALRRAEKAKFSKWGNSVALRIPKALAKAFKIAPGKTALLMKEKNAIKLVVE